jgi:hypothetical protein
MASPPRNTIRIEITIASAGRLRIFENMDLHIAQNESPGRPESAPARG